MVIMPIGVDLNGGYFAVEYVELVVRRRGAGGADELLCRQGGASLEVGPLVEINPWAGLNQSRTSSCRAGMSGLP